MDYDTDTKAARMTATRDRIDSGSGAGVLQVGTAGMASVLFEITLNDPCGTISGAVLTLTGFPKTDASANASGTAAAARIRTSDGTDIVTGLTAGTSGTNVLLESATITAGQPVQINSGTITHA